MLDFRNDPVELFRKGMAIWRDVRSKPGNKPGVVLFGPEYRRLFLEATDHIFSIRETQTFFGPMFQDDIHFLA
jgi:hypothetical protein